ncbi:hypothetical protein [Sporosalibacterium faouarense]|uniref:hypothetical protein n=1 Tax=Sporosalibacterium faouarense TaxID=516123 RepID=UPI00141D5E47|nr:hypothetical protein [Sporosalibacterium faouarense]MTI49112.1 hypothetical protein [Bacillota bacterium]
MNEDLNKKNKDKTIGLEFQFGRLIFYYICLNIIFKDHIKSTLPGFLFLNVAKALVDNFGIAEIGTVENYIEFFIS